jgi:hypothetical protein
MKTIYRPLKTAIESALIYLPKVVVVHGYALVIRYIAIENGHF